MHGRAIHLLRDDSAKAWLENPRNIAEWERLYQKCSWRLATLSPGFCLAWLRHYADHWAPVLILEQHDGKLGRIMPLAADTRRVTGMGAHQAEYQGWLSVASTGEREFLAEALHLCAGEFPGLRMHLRYLVPGLDQYCDDALKEAFPRLEVRHHRRPLLPLKESALEKALRKPGNRSKMNRLAALGRLEITFPSERSEIVQTLCELAPLYDLRQGAINDVCPFVDDPAKLPFLIDWLSHADRSDFHLGRICLDGQLIAGLLTVNGSNTASVAIIAYSPLHGRHSPGKLQLYHSALALARNGLSLLDLTPGGDPWKERFAREHDEVLEITCYPQRTDFIRHRISESLRELARTPFRLAGTPAPTVRERLDSALSGLRSSWEQAKPSWRYGYRLWLPPQKQSHNDLTPSDIELGTNRFQHLLCHRTGGMPRRHFLNRCLECLQHGGILYSAADDQKLLAAWCRCSGQEGGFGKQKCQSPPARPPADFVFRDLYSETGPQGFSAARLVLQRAVKEIRDEGFGGSIMMELGPTGLRDAGLFAVDQRTKVEAWRVFSCCGFCRLFPLKRRTSRR